LERGEAKVENAYKRAVPETGNKEAKQLMETFLKPVDREWRGIGIIPSGSFSLRENFATFDAAIRFPFDDGFQLQEKHKKDIWCISGEIMKGNRQVTDCTFFGLVCKPEHPLGAPMVSAEGVCAAYYNYKTVM